MTITNLLTEEELRAQYNPTKAEVEINAAFTGTEIPNFGHVPLAYKNTSNPTFNTTLTFNQLADGVSETYLLDVEALLYSWCYRPDEADTLLTAAPAPLLLVWPGWLALIVVLKKVKHTVDRFKINSAEPTPTLSTFELNFEAFFRVPIGAQTIRATGLRLGST